ncbi:hypothetical protein [Microbacterium allomyrinae]|uniref:Uncharacterized protein n=1 Tax=Microbacterium allomyrinae TaxID=2830666 RepID=A0A9X1S5U6_9MICO|nr:hypothetical protein [Microbacterium allomyrinae]MCC2034215.1 hypothetical protein [Microbacterium allomyrinae]
MPNDHETAIELPGLELHPDGQQSVSAMRGAVIATIAALEKEGLLEPRHVAMCQLALEMADSVAAGRRSGRASAAAMAAAQLRETLMALPAPVAGDVKARFEDFVDKLVAAG